MQTLEKLFAQKQQILKILLLVSDITAIRHAIIYFLNINYSGQSEFFSTVV